MTDLTTAVRRLNAALDKLEAQSKGAAPNSAGGGAELVRLRKDRALLTEELDSERAAAKHWKTTAGDASGEIGAIITDLRKALSE